MPVMPAKIIHVSIDRDWREVYDFAANPENMPQWASGLASELKRDGNDWIATGAIGAVRVSFAPRNLLGVLDHTVTVESGLRIYNALRVVPNGDGCEMMFTLLTPPGISKEQIDTDADHVRRDLTTLKTLMERKSD
jgi:hypothetical protein